MVILFFTTSLLVSSAIDKGDFNIQNQEGEITVLNIAISDQDNEPLTWENGIDFNKHYIFKVDVGEEYRIINMLVKLVNRSQQLGELNLNSGAVDIQKWRGQLLLGSHIIIHILKVSKVNNSEAVNINSVNEIIKIPTISTK